VPFVAPLALLGLLFLPVVVAMYLLKLRRDEAVVPSTLLWTRLVADVEANAPWQKLRRSLLLLLQLLLVIALALLAARPFLERPAGLARDIVLVVDTSASMGATDVVPDRLTVAKQAAIDALRELPSGGKVSVIAADRSARIVVNESGDLGRVRDAIEGITVTHSRGDMADALELAAKLAARSGDAQILVATDAALADRPTTEADVPIRVLPVGRERRNQAIVGLAVRPGAVGVGGSVFVSIANQDLDIASRRVEVWGDGSLLEVRDVTVEPQARANVIIDDLPKGVSGLEVRLTSPDLEATGDPDQLALDDRAWAVIPPDRTKLILVVGPGDAYLETALGYLPNVELFGVEEYGPETERTDGRPWDLIIFQGALPTELPRTAILGIAPPRTSPLGQVTGVLENPGIGTLDPAEPILRYVDLSTVHIAEAQRMTLPDWARTVIPGPRGAPLLYAGSRDGLPTAVLAFEPRMSDLPLQVAFPVLLANLTGELLGGGAAPTEAVAPGTPVELIIPEGAVELTVTAPDGTLTSLVPSTSGGSAVTFAGTDAPGIYTVTPVPDPDASPAPSASAGSASPGASSSAIPSAAPSAAIGGASSSPPPDDPFAPVRFAVDLFDVDESNIAPGAPALLEALGTGPDPTDGNGGGATERPAARDELWVPIVLLVLVVLCAEWALYHRDGLVKLQRSLGTRFGRADAADGPRGGAG
jgi:Ca-activated chloride channel family protein